MTFSAIPPIIDLELLAVDLHESSGYFDVARATSADELNMLMLYISLALGVSFFCSLLESVLLSTSMSHASILKREGNKVGELWVELKQHDAIQPLTAILTLNTIAHTVGALGVGVEVAATFPGEYTVAIASGVLTIAILLLSEIFPKTLGAAYWKQLGKSTAITLKWMVKIMAPLIGLVLLFKKLMPSPYSRTITRDELSVLADIGEEEGAIERDEEAVIMNLLNLRNVEVSEIMTPRVVISALPESYTVREALDHKPRIHFSRIPLYGESLDDLRGFVLRSDLLLAGSNGEWDRLVSEFRQTPQTVKLGQSVYTVFHKLRKTNGHLAFVMDEFDGTAGVVSLEDAIETMLGEEIVDEKDEVPDMRELAKQRAADKKRKPAT